MSRLLPICPGRRSFGALLPTVTLECVWMCVCRGTEKRLTRHYCTVGNRPGTPDTTVPEVLESTVSHLEINERNTVDFHLCHGLFVCSRTRTVVKVWERRRHLSREKPKPRPEFRRGWSQRQSDKDGEFNTTNDTQLIQVLMTKPVCVS